MATASQPLTVKILQEARDATALSARKITIIDDRLWLSVDKALPIEFDNGTYGWQVGIGTTFSLLDAEGNQVDPISLAPAEWVVSDTVVYAHLRSLNKFAQYSNDRIYVSVASTYYCAGTSDKLVEVPNPMRRWTNN